MFERFTREARRAVVGSQEAAQRMGAERVEPEHLLLGLATGCTPAARAIAELGLTPESIAETIEADLVAMLELVGVPPSVVDSTPALPRADLPGFSLQSKRALEQAPREAVRRRDRRTRRRAPAARRAAAAGADARARVARHDVEPERLAALVQVEVAAARR